ncbi:MAG: hypothetical protein HUU10_07885 [Bacteroidetes bacterium]|nr:hypothetical protein [Bacteroidota bacterium]
MKTLNGLLFTLLVISGFTGGCSSGLENSTYSGRESSLRQAKTVYQYSHAYQFGTPSENGLLTDIQHFDPHGNITIHRKLNLEGKLRSQVNYIYNHLHQLIETRYYNQDQLLESRIVLNYDDLGRHIRNTEYDETGTIMNAEVIRYGSNNLVAETVYYGPDGTILWKTSYLYSDDNQKVEVKTIEGGGLITKREILHLNELGQISERFDYFPSGTVRQIFAYQYNDQGKKVADECYFPDGTLSWQVVYRYDRKGRLVLTAKQREDGIIEHRGVNFYNSDGLVARQNGDIGSLMYNKETFAYDNHGNRTHWIKYDPVLNEPVELVRYTYEYY